MKKISAALVLALAAGLAHGQTYTINFDQDAAGNAIADGSTIANQYAAWGVTFTANVFTGGSWATNTDMTATSTDVGGGYTAGHGNVLHSFGGWLAEDGDASFRIDFASQVDALSVQFVGDSGGASAVGVYDIGGSLITSGVVGAADANGDKVVSFTGLSGLGAVRIGAILPGEFFDWAGVDNITFTYVPAPGAMAILGLGGLAMGRRRR